MLIVCRIKVYIIAKQVNVYEIIILSILGNNLEMQKGIHNVHQDCSQQIKNFERYLQ